MAARRPTRVVQQLLLFSALLFRTAVCPAADQPGVVPVAHGPQVMLYISEPLGGRGASRVYGLRIERAVPPPMQAGVLRGAMPGERGIVDLQIRRYADVRVEFGRRVTWNIARNEFGLSGNQSSMAISLPRRVLP